MKMMIPGIAQAGGELAEELRIENIPASHGNKPAVKIGVGKCAIVIDARQLRRGVALFDDSLAERM